MIFKLFGAGSLFYFRVNLMDLYMNKNEIYQKYLMKIPFDIDTEKWHLLRGMCLPCPGRNCQFLVIFLTKDRHNLLCTSQELYLLIILVSAWNGFK